MGVGGPMSDGLSLIVSRLGSIHTGRYAQYLFLYEYNVSIKLYHQNIYKVHIIHSRNLNTLLAQDTLRGAGHGHGHMWMCSLSLSLYI